MALTVQARGVFNSLSSHPHLQQPMASNNGEANNASNSVGGARAVSTQQGSTTTLTDTFSSSLTSNTPAVQKTSRKNGSTSSRLMQPFSITSSTNSVNDNFNPAMIDEAKPERSVNFLEGDGSSTNSSLLSGTFFTRRRLGGKTKQLVTALAQQLLDLKDQLHAEDHQHAQLEDNLREAEANVAMLQSAVRHTGELANQIRAENERLETDCVALAEKLAGLNLTIESAEKEILTEHRACETVYGWYMGLMLENEALRSTIERENRPGR